MLDARHTSNVADTVRSDELSDSVFFSTEKDNQPNAIKTKNDYDDINVYLNNQKKPPSPPHKNKKFVSISSPVWKRILQRQRSYRQYNEFEYSNDSDEVNFLDQEWKDRNFVSKTGFVLANILTLGGITWGRKLISTCCKDCLQNVNQQNQIELIN